MNSYEELKKASGSLWREYVEHEFVRRIGDGTLPEASFRHYLQQDYLYLVHFTRAWGLAVYKSHNIAQMRQAQAGINTILDVELDLHIQYCQGFGISEQELSQLSESSACVAYTRYILDTGMRGDLAEHYTALMPCFIGYAEVGRYLMAQDFTKLEGNPYKEWIQMYSGEAFQQAANQAIKDLNQICDSVGEQKFKQLSSIFNTATRMEIAFWQMGLDCSM